MTVNASYTNVAVFTAVVAACLFLPSCSSSSPQEDPPGPPADADFSESSERNDSAVPTVELTDDEVREVDEEVERIVAAALETKRGKGPAGPLYRDEERVAECKQRLKDKVTLYKKFFKSKASKYYRNLEWLNTVLAEARTEFDTCLKTAG